MALQGKLLSTQLWYVLFIRFESRYWKFMETSHNPMLPKNFFNVHYIQKVVTIS